MAGRKTSGPAVAFEENRVVVRIADRSVTFPADEEADTGILVVDLDSAAFYDAPHEDEEVDLDALRRITEAIEAAADEDDIEIEFA